MQVSVEPSDSLERTVCVEVPEEKIATEIDSRLKSLSQTTKIQGFRPGKVPIKIIQQRFGARVRQEVIGEVIQSSFYEAITQEKLKPAGSPEIGTLDSEQGKGLTYTAKFEVFPELSLAPVEELQIDKTSCRISDEDVDKMVETLRNQRRVFKGVEREAAMEDLVNVDYKGTVDGEVFEGGEGKSMKVELGAKQLIAGFEDGLLGKKAGDDIVLELVFPEDYPAEDLAGKPVKFELKVNTVEESVLPELNEDFFAEFNTKEGGLDAFRKQIKEHMERESTQVLRNKLRDSVMKSLLAANQVELPNIMVEQEKTLVKQQFESNLKAQGLNVDDIKDANDDTVYQEQAKDRVALQLIVAELIQENGLKVEPAKVRAKIESMAASYEDPSAMVDWFYTEKDRLAEIEAITLEDQVVDWIVDKAKLNELNKTFDEVMNKGQTDSN